MVGSQLLRRGIEDERVLAAMARVPRELFVPPDLRDAAYADAALPIGVEQTISQPYMVALICEQLALQGGERVLDPALAELEPVSHVPHPQSRLVLDREQEPTVVRQQRPIGQEKQSLRLVEPRRRVKDDT